jgi:hypothetical protein
MTAKERWRATNRRLRVARREAQKAAADMVVYGTGVVYVPAGGGDPRHVPFSELTALNQRDGDA